MTFRIGAVGVGPWAQKLATAFRECGAEIVAYDRKSLVEYDGETLANRWETVHDAPGFGQWMHWRQQIGEPSIDALILCAPPDVTTEVALACAKAGKRCVATKPLMLNSIPSHAYRDEVTGFSRLSEGLYVDLWRLYSPAWLALKEEIQGKKIERIDVSFCGNGPFRSFPGVLDYGPHALAFVYDLLGTTELTVGRVEFDMADRVERRGAELWRLEATCSGAPVRMTIGNGANEPERRVTVHANGSRYHFTEPETARGENPDRFERDGTVLLEHPKSLALRRFCRAFMRGEPSRTLEYSVSATRVLNSLVAGSDMV